MTDPQFDAAEKSAPLPMAKRFKVIACEIARHELTHLAPSCPNILDIEYLPQGYHDTPALGCKEVQKRILAVPGGHYDAILLVYGLCNNILAGIRTAHTPLVIPRAHDCITLFLGSRQRYQHRFETVPKTYYYTSGWLECGSKRAESAPSEGRLFMPATLKKASEETQKLWAEKYGEEQAAYLMEVMGGWASTYERATLISFDFTKPLDLAGQVKKICKQHDWDFEQIDGDLGLLQRLLNGDWNTEDYLIISPSEEVAPSYDESVVRAKPF